MSFQPNDFQAPPASSHLARNLALALLPVVIAVPVTIAVMGKTQQNSRLASEIDSLVESGEILPPDGLSGVSGLPEEPGEEAIPPGPVDPATEPAAEEIAVSEGTVPPGPVEEPSKERWENSAGPHPSPAAEPLPGAAKYTVVPGDTLYRIGLKSGRKPEEIAQANQIEVGAPIIPGQVLKIPGTDGEITSTPQPAAPGPARAAPGSLPSGGPVPPSDLLPVGANQQSKQALYCIAYVVRYGDTLDSIAFSLSTTKAVIQSANDPVRLVPGQTLIIPVDRILVPCQ